MLPFLLPQALEDEATIGFRRSSAHQVGEGGQKTRDGSVADNASRWTGFIDEAPFLVALDDSPCTISFLDEVEAESCLLEVIGCSEASQTCTDDECIQWVGGEGVHCAVSCGYVLVNVKQR